jgi:hypothetical protein
MEGVDTVRMAQRKAQFAPSLAHGAELSGFAKVMANLGAIGDEPSNYAKLLWLANPFTTSITDLSRFGKLANSAVGVAGISAGAGTATGIAGTALGGFEIDWGEDPVVKLDIPPVYHWYSTHLWAPPAGAEAMTFPAPPPRPVPPAGTQAPASRAVSGYSVVVPPGWARIPLRHGTAASIQEIADGLVAAIPVGKTWQRAALLQDQRNSPAPSPGFPPN